MHSSGAQILESLVRDVGTGRRDVGLRCSCGEQMQSKGMHGKRVHTLLGDISFERSRYQCPRCRKTRYPGDEELGVEHTSYSPGVQRQVARLGQKEAFREVGRDMKELAGVRISRKQAERISENNGEAIETWSARERLSLCLQEPPPPDATTKTIETLYIELDGTGVPMVPHEVAGRKGKQKDGTAKTREAKLGCVFTQTGFDDQGRPIRDPASTTFIGAIETAYQFGRRLYAEACRRGLFHAKHVIAIGDGAKWIQNLIGDQFGNARFIIDYYHAAEHITDLCRALFDRDIRELNHYHDQWEDLLNEGGIETIIEQATEKLPIAKFPKDAKTQIGYFENNKDYMRYKSYKEQGLFIGSGVIEAGCKTVICQRLKQSGMEWTVRGANAIIALRCAHQSNRVEEYWEQRAA